jgi:hypothetical protein
MEQFIYGSGLVWFVLKRKKQSLYSTPVRASQPTMHLKEKACLAYTLFSSLVGTGWMGYRLAQGVWSTPKDHFCLECKKTIMVSGCD